MNKIKLNFIILGIFFLVVCVPPDTSSDQSNAAMKAELLKKQEERCPQLMSSATEQYNNRNWQLAANRYNQANKYNCSDWQVAYFENLYQYFAIAYEQMGKYDSSEFVCLDGLNIRSNDRSLRIRLAYSYKKQGKYDKEIIEYERLVNLFPDDLSFMNNLSKLYKDNERFDDQIFILEKILTLDESNEIAQSELAMAFENSGKDPLDVYRKRYEDNPENLSYGLDYADRLNQVERQEDAIPVLKAVIRLDPSSKLAYRRLAESCIQTNDLDCAANAYEELFKIDPRDSKVAINISDVYLEDNDYGQAIKWADKAVNLDNKNADAFGQKGKVYYYGWDNFRQNPFTNDDRIVAKLAYDYFIKAENKGYSGFSKSNWMKENEKDILYGKAQWFMAIDKVKRSRVISTTSSDYEWVLENLKAEEGWK